MSVTCTLCDQSVPESEAVWGVDFPDCGPVHDECADLDLWHYERDDAVLWRRISERRIKEGGWLPDLADCLTVRRKES